MAINAVTEVLAGHADAGPFPVAQVVGVHEVLAIHQHSCVSTPVLLAIAGVGKQLLLARHAKGCFWNFPEQWAASALGGRDLMLSVHGVGLRAARWIGGDQI